MEGVGVNKGRFSRRRPWLEPLNFVLWQEDPPLRNMVMGMVGPKEEEGLNVYVVGQGPEKGSRESRDTWKEDLSPQRSVFFQLSPHHLKKFFLIFPRAEFRGPSSLLLQGSC